MCWPLGLLADRGPLKGKRIGIDATSSSEPSSRFTRKRSRHLQTVAPVIRSFFATSPLLKPSSQPSTIRARIAVARPDFRRRANIVSFCFS